MSEAEKLLMEKDGPIGWIIFNQPEKRNAVSQEMWELMPDYVKDLAEDDAIRVVVLRGAGEKAFVAGADISQCFRLQVGFQHAQSGTDRCFSVVYDARSLRPGATLEAV